MIRFFRSFFFVLLLAVFAASASAEAVKNPIPIEDFISPAQIEPGSILISPGGDFFSVIVPHADRSYLVIFDRATMKLTANITPRAHEYISDYWWVSNRRVVATLAVKEGGLETPVATGELWGIDADGKNAKYLFGYRGSEETGTHIALASKMNASATVLEPIANDKDTILIGITPWGSNDALYMELARLNVKTGRFIRTGGKLPIRYSEKVVTDDTGVVRLVSGSTSNRYSQLFYRSATDGEWMKINDSEQSGKIIHPLAFDKATGQYFARVSDIKNPDYLVLLDPVNKTEKLVYKPKYADIGNLQLTADRKSAYAFESFDGNGGYVFLKSDSPEALLTKEMMKKFPGELVIANSFSSDGRYATLTVTSDVNPGEYYLFDRDKKELNLVLKSRPKIDIDKSATVEKVELQAKDGLTLRGWLTLPQNSNGKPPLLVLPHGGPYGIVDRWRYDEEAQLFASRGYAVLQINFRGSGGYGKAFEDAGIGEWGGAMQQDLTDATKWVISQGKVDPAKICIYGASYGAYAAMMAVANEPDIYRCAIGYSGVYDLGIFQNQGDIDDTAWGRSYLRDVMQNDKEWIKTHSPTYLAAKIKAPVLLIHGGADRRTPPSHANAMRAALIKTGNTPGWIYKSDEGHGFFDEKNRMEVYQSILDFLDKNIAP